MTILDPVDERKITNRLRWHQYVKRMYRGDSDRGILGLQSAPNDEPLLGLEDENDDTMIGPFLEGYSKTREKLSKAFLEVVDPQPTEKRQQPPVVDEKADDTETDNTEDDNQSMVSHISVVIKKIVHVPPPEPESRFTACFG